MALIGYARVSTEDQNTEAQQRALEEAGCERIFTDHGVSGTAIKRPGLDKALDHLRKGDTLVVWKLDRLGRGTVHLVQLIEQLHERGVGFQSLQDGITTDVNGTAMQRAMSQAMITIMAAFAQLERDTLSERTKAGLETARQHGRIGGRPTVTAESPVVRRVVTLRDAGEPIKEIAQALSLGESTVYKYLKIARDTKLVDQV